MSLVWVKLRVRTVTKIADSLAQEWVACHPDGR
jgi:hypothetical protein